MPLGDVAADGHAPYVKHPLYPVLLVAVGRVAGPAGYYLLSVAATVGAAMAAWALAGRIDPRLARSAAWVTGAGTPLLFYSFVVAGHTLAAAALGGAVVLSVRTVTGRPGSPPRRAELPVALGGIAALTAFACAIRSEATLGALALAPAAVVAALPARKALLRGSLVAAVGLATAVAVRLAEGMWRRAILGRPRAGIGVAASAGSDSWLQGRWDGLYTTWFRPTHGPPSVSAALLVVGFVVVAATGYLLRTRRRDVAAMTAVGAALLYVARPLLGPNRAIPGLAVAFPVGWAGLWSVHRRTVEGVAARFAAVWSVVTVAAVVLTQYSVGGGLEWGGRFFAIVLPAAVPVLLSAATASVAVSDGGATTTPRHRLVIPAAAVVASAALVLASVLTLRRTHDVHRTEAAAMDRAARLVRDRSDERPVVVSTYQPLAQVDWRSYRDYRWLLPAPGTLGEVSARLASAGPERIVFVASDPDEELAAMADGWRTVAGPIRPDGRRVSLPVYVLERVP